MKSTGKGSFRRGFTAGFSAPYQFMYGGRTRIAYPRRDLVSLAWEKVGTAVSSAMNTERERIGEATKPPARITDG